MDTNMAITPDTALTPNASLHDLFVEARDTYERETRVEMRYALLRPISIQAGDQIQTGFSREISRTGISLLHSRELPRGLVVVSIPTEQGPELRIQVQIGWCRPAGHGWFISGGEFAAICDLGD
jgi:hypothetical protein